MGPDERRHRLLQALRHSETPLTGQGIADELGVTRQVIVQDIALLRAQGNDIIATPQGYLTPRPATRMRKTVAVSHAGSPAQLEEELNLIVDLGGKVLDVVVEHPVYGEIRALLMISSRQDVRDFLVRMEETQAEPLLVLAGGVHLHTIEADSEQQLERIAQALDSHGLRPS